MTTETLIDFDTLDASGGMCTCEWCSGELDDRIQIINRPEGEYIVIDGRLYTGRGAPVVGSEDAAFYVHEDLTPILESCGMIKPSDLWPLKAGVFDTETTVDLWRTMKL